MGLLFYLFIKILIDGGLDGRRLKKIIIFYHFLPIRRRPSSAVVGVKILIKGGPLKGQFVFFGQVEIS